MLSPSSVSCPAGRLFLFPRAEFGQSPDSCERLDFFRRVWYNLSKAITYRESVKVIKTKGEFMTAETTKAQREQLIKDAYSLCRLDSAAPPDEVMELAGKYIEGRIELEDIADIIIRGYKQKYA